MQGKYPTRRQYLKAKAQRGVLRVLLRPLISWKPIPDQDLRPGYSLVIACHAPLAPMLPANFRLLVKQDLSRMDRTVVAMDGPRTPELAALADRVADEFPALRLRFLYQTPLQAKVTRAVRWGWIDCWLNYVAALAAVRTRHAMLHDMDALLLRPDFIESRYDAFLERGAAFMGTKWYFNNGVTPDDRLGYIVEMFLDAGRLRREFRPIDLFNHVAVWKGKTVDFDTLLYPQSRLPEASRAVLEVGEGEWVHPSQVVSQYTYLRRGGVYAPPEWNNLYFIPYFLYLSGEQAALDEHSGQLEAGSGRVVAFLGGRVDNRNFTPLHMEWIEKQVCWVEQAVAGGVREEVRRYLEAIRPYAGAGGTLAEAAAA